MWYFISAAVCGSSAIFFREVNVFLEFPEEYDIFRVVPFLISLKHRLLS